VSEGDVSRAGDRERSGTLYVVATPIGNVGDLSERAREVLSGVDRVLCEDTRRTRRLLDRVGVSTRLESHHEHNERRRVDRLVSALLAGADVALVSDAGTPELSDPGYPLVRAAGAAGVPVVSIPGPSAITAALSVAGLPTDRFVFLGYLPPRIARRRALLERVRDLDMTLVVFEAPHRVAKTLGAIEEVLGDRPAAICRELTKQHEEVIRGGLGELRAHVARQEPRGELTLVIGGAPARETERAFHGAALEMYERLVAEGIEPDEARRRTREVFG
jgi:16S rRNA (cytidine1402-2'-O)-methyltransferase